MDIYEKEYLFKGFVFTQDKKCLEKFKGVKDLKSYDEVKALPEFAGILADRIILIDIDDSDESDILFNIVKGKKLNCVVIQTTRGKHFYFLCDSEVHSSNRTKATLALGITADIKLGKRNSYSVLKYDRKERKILYKTEELQPVPFWLKKISSKPNFNLAEGDGRNQALFNYILTLQSEQMTNEEIKTTIKIINEYFLEESLPENEVDVILRDEAFKKQSFFKGTKFLHDKFAVYLKNQYHIIRNSGNLLMYSDGVYENSNRTIERAMSKEISSLKASQRKEVLAQLDLICDDVMYSHNNLIAFRNGLYNINTDELIPASPEYFVTNKIPWDYNANAYDEIVDNTLNRIACNDADIRSLLEEMIGSCFYRSNTLAGGKSFILVGEGANGKSTLLDVLKVILGENNYSALDLKNMADKFSTVRIYRKLANIGDDISDEFNSDISIFKKVVTGNSIEAQYKGQDVFEFTPYCKLIFSANTMPRIKDKTGAALRRMVMIPFNAVFSSDDEDFDPQIGKKLQTQSAIEYLIFLGIKGLKNVINAKRYTKSEKVQHEIDEYAERNNPILSFIRNCNEEDISFINEPVQKIYGLYTAFCINNGYYSLACPEFSKQFQKATNLISKQVRVNGKRLSVFLDV